MTMTKFEAKVLLHALHDLESKWLGIIRDTEDEDIQSDYGNDLGDLRMLISRIEPELQAEFGTDVGEFSRERAK